MIDYVLSVFFNQEVHNCTVTALANVTNNHAIDFHYMIIDANYHNIYWKFEIIIHL